MKKITIFLITLLGLNLFCFSREINFDYEYHNYEYYIIDKEIKVTNKTSWDVNFSIYGKFSSRSDEALEKILDISSSSKEKMSVSLQDIKEKKGRYEFLMIDTNNDLVTFEISTKSGYLNLIILDMPSFEQIQKYPRYNHGQEDIFSISINDELEYSFNCMYFRCQKNNYSEIFNRYICFYDYELGNGEKGSPEYIKYKYNLICMPCFNTEQLSLVKEKGKQLYELNMEQKKRLIENIELNEDDLSYHVSDYPRISTFSLKDIIGNKYIADRLNYYEVSPIGNDNYDVRGTYSRAVFHCKNVISHFTMSDYQRIITYLGNIDVIRNDGVKLSVPYYECSDKLTSLDSDIEMLVKRNGNWQREISITDEVRAILNK